MKQNSLLNAYDTFFQTAKPYLIISNETEYKAALGELGKILEQTKDIKDDPRNLLINWIAAAIERYEMEDVDLQKFISKANAISPDIALLKVLMSQHKLIESDFPEIGNKSMVYEVLDGTQQLSRAAKEKLAKRFRLSSNMFSGD